MIKIKNDIYVTLEFVFNYIVFIQVQMQEKVCTPLEIWMQILRVKSAEKCMERI